MWKWKDGQLTVRLIIEGNTTNNILNVLNTIKYFINQFLFIIHYLQIHRGYSSFTINTGFIFIPLSEISLYLNLQKKLEISEYYILSDTLNNSLTIKYWWFFTIYLLIWILKESSLAADQWKYRNYVSLQWKINFHSENMKNEQTHFISSIFLNISFYKYLIKINTNRCNNYSLYRHYFCQWIKIYCWCIFKLTTYVTNNINWTTTIQLKT